MRLARWFDAVVFGERFAADAKDLERALDALAVARRQARRGDRIDALQFLVQGVGTVARGLRGERCAHRAIGGRHCIEPVEQRFEVEHRAADEQRQAAAGGDLADQPGRVADEARRRIRL